MKALTRFVRKLLAPVRNRDRVVVDGEILYVWARRETHVQAWWKGKAVRPASFEKSGDRSLWVFPSRPDMRVILLNGTARRIRVAGERRIAELVI